MMIDQAAPVFLVENGQSICIRGLVLCLLQ